MDIFSEYVDELAAACGVGASRPQELDTTAHAASCSKAAALPAVSVVLVALLLKRMLCPAKMRKLYAGTEDAPELEELSSGRRVDSYATRAGRLTTAAPPRSAASKSARQPKPKRPHGGHGRGGAAQPELEPVLPRTWSRG